MAINKKIMNHKVDSTGNTIEVDQNTLITGIDKTVVNYTGLKRYHHQLISALGLIQDTAEYKYNGTRGRWYTEDAEGNRTYEGVTKDTPGAKFEEEFTAESISNAVDKIYDLAKEGGVIFAAGKSDIATGDPIMFNHTHSATEADADMNSYFINAKVGDNTFNIGFNASDFIKDSVLKSVFLLSVIIDSDDTRIYKANGTEAELTPAVEGEHDGKLGSYFVNASNIKSLEAGTYFYYTWITDNGEKADEFAYTSIPLKDVYGDIQGDGTYISYDKETAKISANTAEARGIKESTITEYDVEVSTEDSKVTITSDDTTIEYSLPEDKTAEDILKAEGYDIVDGTGNEVTKVSKTESSIEWKSQIKNQDGTYSDAEKDALATTDNVTDVANTLQDQIDDLKAETLTPGEITLDDTIDSSEINFTNNKVNIKVAVASSDNIAALFERKNEAKRIEPTASIISTQETITIAGEYDINVGEYPVGSNTDITWTEIK